MLSEKDPNTHKKGSFEHFMCLDLVLERYQSFLFQIFVVRKRCLIMTEVVSRQGSVSLRDFTVF